MTYTAMLYIVIAYLVRWSAKASSLSSQICPYIRMANVDTAYIVIAYIVMADIVMAYILTAQMPMACIVMADVYHRRSRARQIYLLPMH